MNPCTTEAPLCVAAPKKPRPRPMYLTREQTAEAARGVVRALRTMGAPARRRTRGHWEDTIDPFDLGPLSDDRPPGGAP